MTGHVTLVGGGVAINGCCEAEWENFVRSSVAKWKSAVLSVAMNRSQSAQRRRPGRARLRSPVQLLALRTPVLSGLGICFPVVGPAWRILGRLVLKRESCCPEKELAPCLLEPVNP